METEILRTVISSAGTSGVVFALAYLWVKSVTDAHKQDTKDWNEYLKGQIAFNAELLRLVVGAVDKLATASSKNTSN